MAERKKKKGKLTAADLASYGITKKQPDAPHFGPPGETISPDIFLDPESHAELMEQKVGHQKQAEILGRWE